ncbi:nitroreductase family protein [Fulvivirga maritima]|uniref:nitroreductase family protein n=1 Tax=Fulvivirga maritima TaxID=2904247 RepID=UPI001F1E7A52|nr:nitroreductase family protein [Fulvivirga maritima]UII25726.1 nitroreductase family protein [Fulvivirga maritima]
MPLKNTTQKKKVSDDDIAKIVEAARMAPSSYGIQPCRVIAVSNQELKEKMVPVAWNQKIVAECSHVLIFAAWDKYTSERVHNIFDYTTDQRGTPRGSAFGSHTEAIANSQIEMTDEEALQDTSRQACIAFAMAIAQAAELKIDNTPMGGFTNSEMDELLSLNEKGLKSVYMLALGYRQTEGDWLVDLKKVRTPTEEFLIEMK